MRLLLGLSLMNVTTKDFNKRPLHPNKQREIRQRINSEIRLFKWYQFAKGAGSILPLIKSCYIPIDLYLLRYRKGECASTHKDNTGKKTYRLNFIFHFSTIGGIFYGKTILDLGFIKLFRSDRDEHGVTTVEKGVRYVVSFGLHI